MITLSSNKILTDKQIELMSGNDTYMKMLRNKLTVDNFRIDEDVVDKMLEALQYTEGFVYYNMENNSYGHGKLELLFENALDMENYKINISAQHGLDKIFK